MGVVDGEVLGHVTPANLIGKLWVFVPKSATGGASWARRRGALQGCCEWLNRLNPSCPRQRLPLRNDYQAYLVICCPEIRLETSLYLPVKRFLEGLGYTVKGEVGRCDLVGLRDDDPAVVVIGELKLTFNLELILQGVDRMSLGDEIWLAAQLSARGKGRESDPRYRNLCRRLGFGLLGVDRSGRVDVLVSPVAPMPRKDPRRRSRLVEEHKRRQGDPSAGGGTRKPVMTAYRQQALACAAAMTSAPQRPRDLKQSFPDAQKILHRNVYGWFERTERGVYALTETGRRALAGWLPKPPTSPDGNGTSAPPSLQH